MIRRNCTTKKLLASCYTHYKMLTNYELSYEMKLFQTFINIMIWISNNYFVFCGGLFLRGNEYLDDQKNCCTERKCWTCVFPVLRLYESISWYDDMSFYFWNNQTAKTKENVLWITLKTIGKIWCNHLKCY